jgi:hypothetical protein
MPEAIALPSTPTKLLYRPRLRDRLRVEWQNWRCRKVGKAVRVLSDALRNDPGFRQTWHANIAMPIYDHLQDIESIRGIAGQAWGTPANASKEMDSDLA